MSIRNLHGPLAGGTAESPACTLPVHAPAEANLAKAERFVGRFAEKCGQRAIHGRVKLIAERRSWTDDVSLQITQGDLQGSSEIIRVGD